MNGHRYSYLGEGSKSGTGRTLESTNAQISFLQRALAEKRRQTAPGASNGLTDGVGGGMLYDDGLSEGGSSMTQRSDVSDPEHEDPWLAGRVGLHEAQHSDGPVPGHSARAVQSQAGRASVFGEARDVRRSVFGAGLGVSQHRYSVSGK